MLIENMFSCMHWHGFHVLFVTIIDCSLNCWTDLVRKFNKVFCKLRVELTPVAGSETSKKETYVVIYAICLKKLHFTRRQSDNSTVACRRPIIGYKVVCLGVFNSSWFSWSRQRNLLYGRLGVHVGCQTPKLVWKRTRKKRKFGKL